MPGKIAAEVAYALLDIVPAASDARRRARRLKKLFAPVASLELRTDIDLTKNKVGIYSRPAKLSDSA